jgi:hypothetical protein
MVCGLSTGRENEKKLSKLFFPSISMGYYSYSMRRHPYSVIGARTWNGLCSVHNATSESVSAEAHEGGQQADRQQAKRAVTSVAIVCLVKSVIQVYGGDETGSETNSG